MTRETLPGRPGTLTPEQEEKLKEFWVAIGKVTGLETPKGYGKELTNGNSDAVADKKSKKGSRFSSWRRGNSKEEEVEVVPEEEDKHGQTKEYYEALGEFTPQEIRHTLWSMLKHDNPDALLLRFLRARKWDVERALIMLIATLRWRATGVHVDDEIMPKGDLWALEASKGDNLEEKKLAEDFLMQLRLGKNYMHGTDNEGRPLSYVRVRLHKAGDQSVEAMERFTVYSIETARMTLKPPVDTACVIFDMTGFSLANMDYQPVKFIIKVFEANYPESLGVVLVYRAPWIFQGIWKVIRGWLDPVVAAKVQFCNNPAELSTYISTPRIITELGGEEDWTYNYIEPSPSENDLMKDTATRDKLLAAQKERCIKFEDLTIKWIEAGKGEDADKLKKERFELADEMTAKYWELDPYIRARTLYDRVGLIGKNGEIDFYPEKNGKGPKMNGTS